MIFDVDDLYEGHDRLDLLLLLKDANPAFRVTAFAVPALSHDAYIDTLPGWIEVVPHGDWHGDPPADGGEWRDWSYDRASEYIDSFAERSERWVKGAKAPGWVISTAALEAFADADWWVADQPYNDQRRPKGLRVHRLGDGDHVHTHVQDWGSNGLNESWGYLLERVTRAESFEWVSDVVAPW